MRVALQTTSGSSSQQQLWGAAFGSYFGVYIDLKSHSFGTIALDSSSWGTTLGTISGNNFGERQLSRIILRNICFEAQQLSSRFTRNFGEQFFITTLDNCGGLLSGAFLGRAALGQLWGCGEQPWGSGRDQLSGPTFGNNFGGTTLRIAFWSNCRVQLCGTAFDDAFWE